MVAALNFDLGVDACLMEAIVKPGKAMDCNSSLLSAPTKLYQVDASLINETAGSANEQLIMEIDAARHGAQMAKNQALKLVQQEQALLIEASAAIALEWECRDLAEKLAALEEDLSQRLGTNGALAAQLSKAIDQRRDDLKNTGRARSCQKEVESIRASCHDLETHKRTLASELEHVREAMGKEINAPRVVAVAEARSCRRAAEKKAATAEARLAQQLKTSGSPENYDQVDQSHDSPAARAAREKAEVELHADLETRRRVEGDLAQRLQDEGRRIILWRLMGCLHEERAEDAVRCMAEAETGCLLARAEDARLRKAVAQASERRSCSQAFAEVARSRLNRARLLSKVSHFGPIAAAMLGAWWRSAV